MNAIIGPRNNTNASVPKKPSDVSHGGYLYLNTENQWECPMQLPMQQEVERTDADSDPSSACHPVSQIP